MAGAFLKEVTSKKISNSMCLYLDWNPSATLITVGLSDGSVSIVSLLESRLEIQQNWKAHDFELWTTSFDTHQPNLVYTGSDDCKFSGWDLRDSPSRMVFQNSKVHKMGVCCIAKGPHDPHSLLTGSYDEYLRVWDLRSISKPINETSVCLGGGVWRVKHHPFIPDLVLAACMHNGFAITSIKGEEAQVLETYKKHDSLAYGADWQRGEASHSGWKKKPLVSTCSFYDRLVRVWMPKNNIVRASLKEVTSEKISNSMCLYLDWNPSATLITVGLSDGSVSIVSLLESRLEIQQNWKAHDFELWTTSFDTHQPNLVYTGSGDCKFSGWDLRDSPSRMVFQNSNISFVIVFIVPTSLGWAIVGCHPNSKSSPFYTLQRLHISDSIRHGRVND